MAATKISRLTSFLACLIQLAAIALAILLIVAGLFTADKMTAPDGTWTAFAFITAAVGFVLGVVSGALLYVLGKLVAAQQATAQTASDIFFKIIKAVAIFAAAVWAIFTFGITKYQEFESASSHSLFASPSVRVEQISGADPNQPRYLVTVTTELQNNSDRSYWLNYQYLNIYLGTLEPASTGAISPFTILGDKSIIKWSLFRSFEFIEADYEKRLKQKGEQPESGMDPASIGSDKGFIRRFNAFELPSKQSTIFENQFVITASLDDWIGIEGCFYTDQFNSYKARHPYERVENIGLKLRDSRVAAPQPKQVAILKRSDDDYQ